MNKHLSMRTANPALQSDTFRKSMSGSIASNGTMTINGVVNKTGLSLLLLIISASITWSNPALSWLGMVGTFAGLILAVVTIFKPTISHLTVPAYAIMQGLFLGLIEPNKGEILVDGKDIKKIGYKRWQKTNQKLKDRTPK